MADDARSLYLNGIGKCDKRHQMPHANEVSKAFYRDWRERTGFYAINTYEMMEYAFNIRPTFIKGIFAVVHDRRIQIPGPISNICTFATKKFKKKL